MSVCPYPYFTSPEGFWEITLVEGTVDETVGHVIWISGPTNDVKIECEGGHSPFYGKYNADLGRIEAKEEGLAWTIICIPKEPPEKNSIKYAHLLVTGSWTAEDNGGVGGGEEG